MRNPVSRGHFRFAVSSSGTGLPDIEPTKDNIVPEPVLIPAQPPPAPARLSRHERRKNNVFNQRLKRRLEADGTPVSVEVLPDGGLHVTVKKPEEA